MSFSHSEERTYSKLLATLGASPEVAAECYFVDPIADIAILGPPDNQELPEQFEAYDTLLSETETIEIGRAVSVGKVWLLSLGNEWHPCNVRHSGRGLWYFDATNGIRGGMSGSPALDATGRAVGVVCAAGGLMPFLPAGGEMQTYLFIFQAGCSRPSYKRMPVYARRVFPKKFRIGVNVAASMDEAQREARKLIENGVPASVVQVEDLVGYSGVPRWMSMEEVAEQIGRHLCKAKNIPYVLPNSKSWLELTKPRTERSIEVPMFCEVAPHVAPNQKDA